MSVEVGPMPWSPRRKAAVFSFALLAVSTLFVAGAAASANGALAPFLEGADYARERALTRQGHAVGLLVAAAGPDGVERASGASAVLERVGGGRVERETDVRGLAVFHVRAGVYRVSVSWQGLEAERAVEVSRDVRLGVYFDEAGRGHWLEKDHGELERRGESWPLGVRVQRADASGPSPVEGARVEVFRWVDGARGAAVASASTDARGVAIVDLHRGAYEVVVTHGDGSMSQMLRHHEPRRLVFTFGQEPVRESADAGGRA